MLRTSRRLAFAAALALAAGCADDVRPLSIETVLVTDTNDTSGPYEVQALVRDDTEVTAAWVFYSTDRRRNFEPVRMERVQKDAYRAGIPGFPLGTRVDYYVLARDAAANTGTDPDPVPERTHCFMVGTFPSHPQLWLVTPDRGPTTGGTPITLIGRDFRPGARVFLETGEATGVVVHDASLITAVTPAGEPGLADVTVRNPSRRELADAACPGTADDEPATATLEDGFLYVLPPTPTEVVPDRGPTSGGTVVTVRGAGFQQGATVTFDGVEAMCAFVSAAEITCVTPPGEPGPADVRVVNPDDLEGTLPAGYLYVPPPEVLSVEPPRGPDAGGTPITVRGRGFEDGAIVFFDGIAQDAIAFVDGATLTARTLPHAVGFVDVSVRNPDGQVGRLPRGFFYFGPPRIDAILPPRGPTSGGTRVRIRGASFVPGLTVVFDGLPAILESVNEEEIVVLTPPHPEGPVTVVVTNPDGRSASGTYTYVPLPDIDGLSPTCGPAAGGTEVVVRGRNYQEGAVVFFGVTAAAMTTVLSPAVIRAVTPMHPGATVEVRVRNPDGGESPAPGTFTFVPAPRIDSVTPPAMFLCGGVDLVIRGGGFLPGATVAVGDLPCANVRVVSPTEIRCVAPAAPPGPRRVTVTNHECLDQSATSVQEVVWEPFTLQPTGGLIAGFTNVRVSHSLPLPRPITSVRFGGVPALEVRPLPDPTAGALAQSPPHEVGELDVEVTMQGCAPEAAGRRFQYRVFVDRTFERVPHPPCRGDPIECHAAHIAMGDLNGDGLNDFVQANGGIDPTVRQSNLVYLNRADRPGAFVARDVPDPPGGPQNNSRVDLADIDADGDRDLLFAGSRGGRLYLNDGTGTFARAAFSSTLEGLGGSFDAQFADVNQDGRPDIVYLEIGIDQDQPNQVPRNGPDHVYLNRGGGRFTEVANAFPSTDFSVHDHKMALARFNSDANLDLVVVVDTLNFLPRPQHRLYYGDGAGHFRVEADPVLRAVAGDVFGIEVGDLDGDGRPDLFLPVEGRGRSGGVCGITIAGRTNVLLLNDGTGHFVDRSDLLPAHADPTIGSASFDVDLDGDIDLVAVNHGVPTRIYVNDGTGGFHDATAALRDPPLCALSAAGGPVDRTGIPALVIGGLYPTRLWMQTHEP